MALGPDASPLLEPQHNILISIPRTASNLVTHLLALPSQPSVLAHPRDGYFFLPAISARFTHSTFTRPFSSWSPQEKTFLDEALAQGISAWEAWIADAEKKGLGTYVKEHVNWMISPKVETAFLHPRSETVATASRPPSHDLALDVFSNPTAVPSKFWTRVRTTLLVRHPALTFPSALRTAIDNEGLEAVLKEENEYIMQWECTFEWHMMLYQFLTSQDIGRKPLIIDASQLQDEMFVQGYVDAVGLDSRLLRTRWAATSKEEQGKLGAVERRMKDTLLGSSGIVPSKLSSQFIDVAAHKQDWESEFGLILAQRLERLVQGAMQQYEWLYERRWTG